MKSLALVLISLLVVSLLIPLIKGMFKNPLDKHFDE